LILVVDNFDSFTYNLVDYLQQLSLKINVLRNTSHSSDLFCDKYTGVVLSPGPGIPKKAGYLMKIIDYYYLKIPILGICLGHQAIGEFFGAKLAKAQKPMHGKTSNIDHNFDVLFQNIPRRFSVTRYHSLICTNLPNELQVLARTDIGETMALKHQSLPIYGLQFHPEAVLTEYGLELLRNWKNINSFCN